MIVNKYTKEDILATVIALRHTKQKEHGFGGVDCNYCPFSACVGRSCMESVALSAAEIIEQLLKKGR